MPKFATLLSRLCLLFTVGFSATVAQSQPQNYPSKPITIVVPYTPGALADTETRIYIPGLTADLGQPIIIAHKPGAGTSIGAAFVAKASPDGYTIFRASAGFVMNPAFYPPGQGPFDPLKDFTPLSITSEQSAILLVHPSLNVKTFPEYLAYVRANPGKINFGTVGAGSNYHLAAAWLHGATKTEVTYIHYQGAGRLMTDFLAGRVNAAVGIPSNVANYVKSGQLLAIANMGRERSRLLPNLQTLAELGVEGYNYSSWSGYVVPAGTPAAIVNRLSAAFSKVAKSPEVIKTLETMGAEAVGSSSEQFRQLLVTEVPRWRKVVEDNKLKKDD